jgi:hypothetical protein
MATIITLDHNDRNNAIFNGFKDKEGLPKERKALLLWRYICIQMQSFSFMKNHLFNPEREN